MPGWINEGTSDHSRRHMHLAPGFHLFMISIYIYNAACNVHVHFQGGGVSPTRLLLDNDIHYSSTMF